MRFFDFDGSVRLPKEPVKESRKFTEMELAIMEGGGSLDKPTPNLSQLAKKFNVGYDYMLSQLHAGIRVELEHTSNSKIATEIALDHLSERPDYYIQLAKIEEHKKGVRAKKYNKKPKKFIEPIKPSKPEAPKVKENFADGRNPQDKGDSKRHGVPTKASVSTLRKVAKQGGRKGQLAHWMANMKAGRAKK
jgi:hypothetical protein